MMTAVFIPMTSPRDDTSGPPELPGLSAASVWITSSISLPVRERKDRPSADRHCRLEAKRIANRNYQLTALERLGITQRRARQIAYRASAQ